MQKRAILFQVKTNQEKVNHLTSIAKRQFDLGHRLFIRTLNANASQSIDRILWSHPAHSFLPHRVSLVPTEEKICISHLPINVNESGVCFNLTPDALIDGSFSVIYDFDDFTSPEKQGISSKKIKSYQEALFSIASF